MLYRPNSLRVLAAYHIELWLTLVGYWVAAFLAIRTWNDEISVAAMVVSLFTITGYSGLVGWIIESRRINRIATMINSLEELRPIYHNRLTVTELLSVYEDLRDVPEKFWEEYSNLCNEEVSSNTNALYRERAAPFHRTLLQRYARISIVGALAAVPLPVILAVADWLLAG